MLFFKIEKYHCSWGVTNRSLRDYDLFKLGHLCDSKMTRNPPRLLNASQQKRVSRTKLRVLIIGRNLHWHPSKFYLSPLLQHNCFKLCAYVIRPVFSQITDIFAVLKPK